MEHPKNPDRSEQHARLRKALTELTRFSQEVGLYDREIDPASIKRLSEILKAEERDT